jgi:hypothetical protein
LSKILEPPQTNLQKAYLGFRSIGGGRDGKVITVDLSYSDFYQADLSGASLKGAKVRGAVFYQARMHNTVLSRADLQGANFLEADLKGAKFDGALLNGATFPGARNIPLLLASKLNEDGVYQNTEPFRSPPRSSAVTWIRVFISRPGTLDYQQQLVASLLSSLETEGIIPQTLERPDYPSFGSLGEVRRLMSGCAGAIIFGFRQLEVREGVWRRGTPEEECVRDMYFSTPWNQIEAGAAAMLGLPALVACQRGVVGVIFDLASNDYQVYQVFLDEDQNSAAFLSSFSDWCASVRERNRAS